GDRSPERRQRSTRHVERKIQDMRTNEDKKKCRDRGACYKCGQNGHNQFDADAPCRGKPITPSNQIPFLAAMDIPSEADEDHYNDVVDEDDASDIDAQDF
ncbi:hypothetical protein BDW02DRAFT_512902, partial [Decorospora gaudefroyi]